MAKAKILIIDDSKVLIDTVSGFLTQRGYTMLAASCGADAFTLAEVEKPDLILLDIGIPEMDGFTIGRKLKENNATKGIPVVMLTAHNTHDDHLRAVREAKAIDFIPKPFRLDFMLQKIENILGGS